MVCLTTVLDSARYRFEYPMITTDQNYHSTGFMLLDDENPNNNKISLVMKIITKNAIAGQTVTISVSPISISLKIESTSLKEIDKAAGRLKEIGENEYLDNYLYLGGRNIGRMLTIKTFENVINDKEIASIVFFGTKIPIDNRISTTN
jgi:hypothetical protein